jgi:hypothetical protein
LKQLLLALKKHSRHFKVSTKKNEGKCWPEVYKCVKIHKGNRENTATMVADKLVNGN